MLLQSSMLPTITRDTSLHLDDDDDDDNNPKVRSGQEWIKLASSSLLFQSLQRMLKSSQPNKDGNYLFFNLFTTQSAGAVEYTNYIAVEE